jgi:heat shock protein HtpX
MSKNVIKSFVFMAALSGLLIGISGIFGRNWLFFGLFLAIVMNMGTYFFSDKLVIKLTRSKPVSEQEAPWLYRIVRDLTEKADMPMPKLYVMPAAQPNAFATGRDPEHAVVAVTEGILNVLNEEELQGVLAHEISHVRNRDVLIGAIAATIAAAITMIARFAMWGALLGGGGDDDEGGSPFAMIGFILSIFLAPIAALLIQMAVSRARESEADRSGARLNGDATPLANALIKIHEAAKSTPSLAVNPAVAHVFLMNPFRGQGMVKLFMSHPPLEERLAQLRELGARV